METNRNEHTPDIHSQTSASAFIRTLLTGEAAQSLSLENATQYLPWLKGYFEALKKFKDDHSVQYIEVLLKEIYRQGLMGRDRTSALANALDDHDGVKLYLSYANDAAERSFSKRAKAMLAIYSGRVISDPSLLEKAESAVILEILSSVNDFDLVNFERLFEYIFEYQDFQPDSYNTYYRIADKYDVPAGQREEGLLSFDSSLRKLINIQAINIVTGNSGTGSRMSVKISAYSQKLSELCAEYEEFYDRTQEEPS